MPWLEFTEVTAGYNTAAHARIVEDDDVPFTVAVQVRAGDAVTIGRTTYVRLRYQHGARRRIRCFACNKWGTQTMTPDGIYRGLGVCDEHAERAIGDGRTLGPIEP